MSLGDLYEKVSGAWVLRGNIAGPPSRPALVTSLPSSPTDGDEVYYLADATNSVIWHLRYRSAAPGSYKWEFVGGGRKRSELFTPGSTTSTSAVDFPGAGLAVTAPLKGDYHVEFHTIYGHNVGTAFGIIAVKVGAAAALVDQGVLAQTEVANCNVAITTTVDLTVPAASTVLKMQYWTASNTMTINNAVGNSAYMMVHPVRVGL